MVKAKQTTKKIKAKKPFKLVWFAVVFAVLAVGPLLYHGFAATYYGNNSSSTTQSGSATSGSVVNGQVIYANGQQVTSGDGVVCKSGQTCRSGNVVFVNKGAGDSNASGLVKFTTKTTKQKKASQKISKKEDERTHRIVCPARSTCKGGGVALKNNSKDNIEVEAVVRGASSEPDNLEISDIDDILCEVDNCDGEDTTIIYNPGGTEGEEVAEVIDPNTDSNEIDRLIQSVEDEDSSCPSGEICTTDDAIVINNSEEEAEFNTSGDAVLVGEGEDSEKAVCTSGQVCNHEDIVIINRTPDVDRQEIIPNENIQKYIQSVRSKKLSCKKPRVLFIYDLTSRSFFGSERYKYFYNELCSIHF